MEPLTLQEAKDKRYSTDSFSNGDYKYGIDGREYLIRNGKEIARGFSVRSYCNGDYKYDVDGIEHLIRDGKEIIKGEYVWSFDNGDYGYGINEVERSFNKEGKEITS